ncbi:MAG: DUF6311 domain-containing protein [Pikeienuella sp.]
MPKPRRARPRFRASPHAEDTLCYALLALAGAAIFLVAFDPRILDPGQFGWLLMHDWGKNFVGTTAFLQDPWSEPPGAVPRLQAPAGTSIVYTDSFPGLSLALKAALGPGAAPLQFQGWWFFACVLLQGMVGFWALKRIGLDRITALLGGGLLLLWAPMYHRIMHDTLTGHWILLLAMGLLFTPRLWAGLWGIALLGALSVLIHAYLTAMLGLVLLGGLVAALLDPRRTTGPPADSRAGSEAAARRLGARALWAGAFGALGFGLAVLSGYGVLPLSASGAGGAGYFSMNLMAPINPERALWSTLLPPLPVNSGQYEGFLYLGAGGLSLVLLALLGVVFASPGFDPQRLARFRGLAAAGLLALLFALSPVVTLGQTILAEIQLPESLDRLVDVFRATGRFAWIFGLALLLWAIAVTARLLPRPLAATVLASAVALQAVDLAKAPEITRALTAPRPERQAEAERLAAAVPDGIRRLAFAPRGALEPVYGYPVLFAAAMAGLETTQFPLTRVDHAALRAESADLRAEMRSGELREDTTYLAPRDDGTACALALEPGAGLVPGRGLVAANGSWIATEPVPPFFRARRLVEAEGSLAGLIDGCGAGCALALAVSDEGSRRLPPAVVAALQARGAMEIGNLGFRHSYLAVLAEGQVVAEMRSSTGPVSWRGQVGGAEVAVTSSGNGYGPVPTAHIAIEGLSCVEGRIGFNGVLWDLEGTGGRLTPFRYDTYTHHAERPEE